MREKVSADAPGPVTEIDARRLAKSPGVNLDDRLRDLPGFTLFRRSSSLVAHPTTQGVSLRGIGSTGASRTLVLWDGVPVNDPFGGWVYWTRIAPEELDRVEVSRGASTSIFGDRAMGGAISLFTREPEPYKVQGSYQGGARDSHELFGGFSHLWSRWAVSGHARAFDTSGYYIVPENVRGAVDRPATVSFAAGDARLDWLGASDRLFLKFDMLAEERGNGTVLQRNSTGLGTIAAHYHRDIGSDQIALLAYHTREEFRSIFSAIAPSRATERETFRQSVPAEGTGAAAMWSLHQNRFNALAGGDAVLVEGYSRDALFPSGLRVGGGRLFQHGLFAQTDLRAGPAKLFGGVRHDFAGRGQTFLSPSAGLLLGTGILRARASVYRSFRAPTLNEFFREFRAGNATTRANPDLRPETLFGTEAGFDLVGESTRASLTMFRNSLSDLITNVTLSVSSNEIVRQRQNAASAVARGLELNALRTFGPVRAEATYLFVDSRFGTHERLPQVPKHQGSARLTCEWAGTFVSAGVRSYGYQFEDDRNQFLLPGFATAQLAVRQRLTSALSAIASLENLLDRRYLTGFSPTPAIGAPRLWRAGLRWEGRLR